LIVPSEEEEEEEVAPADDDNDLVPIKNGNKPNNEKQQDDGDLLPLPVDAPSATAMFEDWLLKQAAGMVVELCGAVDVFLRVFSFSLFLSYEHCQFRFFAETIEQNFPKFKSLLPLIEARRNYNVFLCL
jgi:hypothetical protein